MGRKQAIKKEINLSRLPRLGGTTNKIDWYKSKGYIIDGIYNGIGFDFKIIDYQRKGQKLTVLYNEKEYNITTCNIINAKLGIILGEITTEYKYETGQTFKDDKRNITIIDRKKAENPYNKGKYLKYYKYKCNLCGFDGNKHYSIMEKMYKNEFWIAENNLKKYGCSCCHNFIVVEGINTIFDTAPWMIPIINDDEFCKTHTRSSKEKIFPICTDCYTQNNKLISINDIYNHYGFSCSKCGDGISYPNKFMFNILSQLNIEFETEYNPTWCKYTYKNKLRKGFYDFYISSMNLIIEMDGGFHNKDNKMNGQTKEDSKFIDNEKDRLAKEHGIEVIRIDCDYSSIMERFEYIKNNVTNNNKLINQFNIEGINWNECNIYSNSNLVKTACELKKNNFDITIKNISKIMKYKNITINGWIKEGHKLGWC